MAAPTQSTLPMHDQATQAVEARLRKLAMIFDGPLRKRVTRLLLGAAEAALSLSEVDLVRHETGEDSAGHTLALWEELAPVMGGTVESVNGLIAIAQEEFPPPPEQEGDDDLDAAFGPSDGRQKAGPALPADGAEGIAALVGAVTSGMRRDVSRLGERLKNPTIFSDAWNLISDLLEFRGRMRAGLGELIFQVCSIVAEVDRVDVVPGYAADLDASLLVRQATTNLAFLFRGHAKRIGGATDERIVPALRDALKDLHAFSRTRALPALRTSDKRIFLETRAELYRLVKQSPPATREIRLAAENLARFLDSMSVVSRRENLRLHDRSQMAAAGRLLEQAHAALGDPAAARRQLGLAVQAAVSLYGRDPQLDAYLRAQRHFPADWLNDAELSAEMERIGALLSQMT